MKLAIFYDRDYKKAVTLLKAKYFSGLHADPEIEMMMVNIMEVLEEKKGVQIKFRENLKIDWNPTQKQIDRLMKAKVNNIAVNYIDVNEENIKK